MRADRITKTFTVGGVWGREHGRVEAVRNVTFAIEAGETFGLVGESGCGKTTVARLVLRLEPLTSGMIYFKGTPIRELDRDGRRRYQRAVQAVFQNPFGSLNPRMRVGDIVTEPLVVHTSLTRRERRRRAGELLERVGLGPDSASRYPHQFSGGQRQRLAIARALALGPELIVLDEAMSSLDVSVQAQIVCLLQALQAEGRIAYLLIGHNLAVVQQMSDRIAVMYLGQLVEVLLGKALATHAVHPYTRALLASIPAADPDVRMPAPEFAGEVPSPLGPPTGCRFHPRCAYALDACADKEPDLEDIETGHWVACPRWRDVSADAGIARQEEEAP